MSDTTAPLSALFWWIIPITALTGAIIYVVWVTKFKSKYENRVDRSVGRFQKFQDSLAPTNGAQSNGAKINGAKEMAKGDRPTNGSAT